MQRKDLNSNNDEAFINLPVGNAGHTSVVVLDVRTADEFAEGHIARAVNIDVKQSDFMDKAKATLPKGKTIAVYCRSGRRSANACEQLSSEGFKTYNLKGGIIAWNNAHIE